MRALCALKRSKHSQIRDVPAVVVVFGSLQHLGDSAETLIVEKEGKAVGSDLTSSDVFMSVDSGSQRLLRVIEMECADVLDAYMAIDLGDGALVPAASSDVIARGKDVAGINADAQA